MPILHSIVIAITTYAILAFGYVVFVRAAMIPDNRFFLSLTFFVVYLGVLIIVTRRRKKRNAAEPARIPEVRA